MNDRVMRRPSYCS